MPSRGGFTLLEMLIVGMLGALLLAFAANATRWYTRSISDQHISSELGRELKFAAQAIAQDFGRSVAAQTGDGTDLLFDYDSNGDSTAQWAAPDKVIRYVLQGGVLLRRDLSDGTEIPIARNINTVSVSGDGTELDVYLLATYRTTQQDLTLALPNP